jgi:2-amino-4-hydroxy-6-hydroxymethyldihydropteridine diphosphokinase
VLVYLSIGSNIGNRVKNLRTAIKLLKKTGFSVIKTSSVYETSAWPIRSPSDVISGLASNRLKGVTKSTLNRVYPGSGQPNFLNLALKGETKLSPEELLKKIKCTEKTLGRKPAKKWGPRTIDIDILFYDKKISKNKTLTIPHPQLHKRAFVLVPLKEIAPRLVHPIFKKTITQLLKDTNDKGCVVRYNE